MASKIKAKKAIAREEVIELGKDVSRSIISVNRQDNLQVGFLNPKDLDTIYATVPEVSRAIDLRGAALISRGYEINSRDDSSEAKDFASLCLHILNKSGGVDFIERFQKNGDLYGDAYVELVDDGSKILELAHVHSYNFGYELETYNEEGTWKSKIKLDNETKKPVGYASYQFDETRQVLDNKDKFPLEKIAHLKYKVVGDALNGISMVQPMNLSIIHKLSIENGIVAASKLVSAPKIVIKGEFDNDEEARAEAREAASLDVNDVVVLQNGKEFEIITPGKTNLPELREIFITNITTTTGIPRPILTSEGNDINKATIVELMKFLRENLTSNANKIKNIMENFIFKRIGESYGVNNFENILPTFDFPEDKESENEAIVREERKAATLTSLSNTIMILNNMLMGSGSTPANSQMKKELEEAMANTFMTFNDTIKTFTVNNDQQLGSIEEEPVEEKDGKATTLSLDEFQDIVPMPQPDTINIPNDVETSGVHNQSTLVDTMDERNQPDTILRKHDELHMAYEAIYNGADIIDSETGKTITLPQIVEKHKYYLKRMEELGLVHEPCEIGPELDSFR